MKDEKSIDTPNNFLVDPEDSTNSEPSRNAPSSFILHPSSLLKWLVHLSRFGLAGLFLITAGAKLAVAKTFASNVGELLSASGLNFQRWMWPTTVIVIASEVVIAVFLFLPRTIRLGAILAALMLIAFAGYALYYVYVLHGEPLECGCFGGIIASQLGVKTALRNLALLLPVGILFFGSPRLKHKRPQEPPSLTSQTLPEISVVKGKS
ncbi:MAG TPA: MauE/DoxX family redox-associated membrane protein [Pyrinomonadaceae bacterium]|nr:MauE/DoxX family redox-associated membrane protein [Pyrinomonadaceae bacterium]